MLERVLQDDPESCTSVFAVDGGHQLLEVEQVLALNLVLLAALYVCLAQVVKTESVFLTQEVGLALDVLEEGLVRQQLPAQTELLVAEDVLQHVVSRLRWQ